MSANRSVLGIRQHGTKNVEVVANLTRTDRCDSCPAAAQAVILLGHSTPGAQDNILLFCTHHLGKNEAALDKQGATIYRQES